VSSAMRFAAASRVATGFNSSARVIGDRLCDTVMLTRRLE